MRKFLTFLCVVALVLGLAGSASAVLIGLSQGSFTPAASVITFSEKPLGTVDPVYDFGLYNVSFGGFFDGGLGTPTVGSDLALDPNSPDTFITGDAANPTSPVLSGGPRRYNGPVAILFSQDVAAVGLDGGYFDAIGGTTIAAYDRTGHSLGSITNSTLGIEFFGLGDDSGDAVIAGIQFYITGNEPAGYAIDNVTFAFNETGYNPGNNADTPEPSTILLMGLGLLGLAGYGRKRSKKG